MESILTELFYLWSEHGAFPRHAFEMGFTWSAALRGEITRFCPPPETLYEKSPASGA